MSDKSQQSAPILIVEDNDINAKLLTHFLEPYGLTIKRLKNGQQAIEFVCQQSVRLIMMDINMPVMNGCEATKRIRALQDIHQPAIVAVTADATMATEQLCKTVGMDGFIPKPLNAVRLKQIVDQLLER